MIPVMCMVKDDHENGSYGDCVRACVASILDLESSQVPHFFAAGPEMGQIEMQNWLAGRDLIMAMVPIPGQWSIDQMYAHMQKYYEHYYYMLWCSSGGGDHAIVCKNNEIAHNPAWFRSPIDGPHSAGYWVVWIIANL